MNSEQSASRPYLIGVLLVFVGAILYATKAIFVKLAYDYEVESVILLALRMLFALPVYLWFAFRSPFPANQPPPTRKETWLTIAVGIMGYYLASLFDFVGLQYITASMERLVLYIYPTLVLLISWLAFGQRINRTQWLALLLAYLGIGVVLLGDASIQEQTNLWLGAGWVFLAALFFAGYIVGNGQLVQRFGTKRFTAYSMLAATAAILIHSLIQGHWPELAWQVYGYGLLMAMVATVIPSFLITEGIRRIGASSASIIGSIGPVSTIILAYLFLDERLGWVQWLGTAIVMTGILLITLRKG
ncbi:MAG: EamA family transporter [Bacteroidota bacterium]